MNHPPVVTLDKLEAELRAMAAPYKVVRGKTGLSYAVFCCGDCRMKYEVENFTHFNCCEVACFDGFENAFELGLLN